MTVPTQSSRATDLPAHAWRQPIGTPGEAVGRPRAGDPIIDDGPWAARGLTAYDLAKLLRPYEISPRDVRETGTGPARKVYDRIDFHDVFTRYLPPAAAP